MTIDSLRGMLDAVPFAPFMIHLADGRSVPVPHPDFVTVTGGGRTAIVTNDKDDYFVIVDVRLVTQLAATGAVSPGN